MEYEVLLKFRNYYQQENEQVIDNHIKIKFFLIYFLNIENVHVFWSQII